MRNITLALSLFVVVLYNLICHCIKLSVLQLKKQMQNALNATTKQSQLQKYQTAR